MFQEQPHIQGQSLPTSSEPVSIREEESLRDIIRVLRKRAVTIVVAALLGLMIALLLCFLMRPQYTSVATLLVDKDQSAGLDLGSLSSLASAVGGQDDVKTELQTHADILEGDTNVLKVVELLHLRDANPYKVTPGFLVNSRLRAEIGRPLDQAPATRERILAIFAKKLKVEPAPDTRLITISYEDYDPDRAALIANTLVNTYIHEYLESKFQATAQASDWLSAQLADLKKRVEESQRQLSQYEHDTGLSGLMLGIGSVSSSPDSSGGGGITLGTTQIPEVEKLTALNAELTAAEENRIAKEAIYKLTQTQSPDVVIGLGESSLTSVGGPSAVVSQGDGLATLETLRQQQMALKVSYADSASKYGALYPRLDEMRAQMKELDNQLRQELERIQTRAGNDLKLAQTNESALQAEYTKQQGAVTKVNDNMDKLEVLAGQALSNRALYEALYTKLQEAGIEAGVKATNLNLVEPARPMATPTRPDWLIYPIAGFAGGLLFGICAAFLRENLDDAVSTPEQVEKMSPYPVLTYIPKEKISVVASTPEQRSGVQPETSPLLTAANAPIAEAYRVLRTSIQFSTVRGALHTLLITSPLGGDGKTTVGYNLSLAYAQHGERVLVIDADLRKPRMHHMFGEKRSPGLSEILAGRNTLAESIRPHRTVAGLSFLPAGKSPPNPAEMLDSPPFDELLAEARKNFDLVIIDSPPLMLVTDPIVLTSKVDGTILVIRSGVTTRPILTRALEMLWRCTGRKLGIILNAVDTSSIEYYYSYGYYGDQAYYGEESPKS